MFLNTTTGRPGPAKASPSRQHSQVFSLASRASEYAAPPSFDDAKNSPAPSYFLPSCFAGTRFRLSIQAENTEPSASSPSATKRWLSLFDVIGFGSAKLLPPSADLVAST